MHSPQRSITAYILAKDGNRPHLLEGAFVEDAFLRMVVKTDAISFPATSDGRAAIAQTLVRSFSDAYENVYTFCLGEAPGDGAVEFSCRWLVAMNAKETGVVRVGGGRYDWRFAPDDGRVTSLEITIEEMQLMPPDQLRPVMDWAAGLPYPWCGHEAASVAAAGVPCLRDLMSRLIVR